MHTIARLLVATGVVACAAGAAWAQQPPIKPGLWQIHVEEDSGEMAARMREMEAHMKNMPPEQRKQVEAMMKQHGVSMGSPGDMRICLSKEQLARDDWQGRREQSGCKTDTTRSGNTWKFHSSCPAPQASETDGEAVFASPENYTVKSTTTSSEGGQSRTMKMTAVSKWLGADCGDIKPAQPPKRK